MDRTSMELREDAIRAHYAQALAWLTGFDHAPRLGTPAPAAAEERSPGIARGVSRFRSTTPGLAGVRPARADGVRLTARIEGVGGDDLPSPASATVLRALRRALAIALAVADEIAARSGAAELRRANLEGRLPAERRAEFAELLAVESLAALAVTGNATAFLLGDQAGPDVARVSVDEVLTDSPHTALQGALWALDQAVAGAADDAALIARTLGWAEALVAAAAARGATVPRAGAFTAASWRVAADDFAIEGFAPATRARGKAPAMAFRRPEEVIGNAIAKHQAMRLARMMVAYDFDRRTNPFVELGGFVFTFLGDGKPGTGKTTLIQMMAGLLNDYCTVAGYPFRYANLSVDTIDSYQGKSGQNARAFINGVLDPAVIGFGTIDDIDQIAGKRGDRQSSAGQQEITAVLMDAFAGAGTVVRGNCTFGMFSNYAEAIDDALRQRASARFLIDGPITQADYVDILALLLGKRHDIPVGDHDLMAAQEMRRAVAGSYDRHARPQEAGLAAVFEAVTARLGPLETLADLGTYLHAIAQAEPRFTGRAVKNITDAVKARAMDFDMPDDWFTAPAPFLHQPYEQKLAMIAALRQPVTPAMVVQEINRYGDSEWRYSGSADETAIADAVRGMERMAEAQKRFRGGGGA